MQVRKITVTTPAAGANVNFTMPLTCIVTAVRLTLVTDANVAARQVILDFQDEGGNSMVPVPTTNTQAAGLTRQWSWQTNNQTDQLVGTTLYNRLPKVANASTWLFKTAVLNIQAGDQISAVRLTVLVP